MKNVVHIFAFLSAMGLMTACTQADMTDNTLLPEGSCTLGLNVSITDNSAATRATPDGTWKGDGTESVAVGVSFEPSAKPTPKANAVQGLESGYSYKYNVTIYKEELNITEANIEPWVDASVENDGNVDATI